MNRSAYRLPVGYRSNHKHCMPDSESVSVRKSHCKTPSLVIRIIDIRCSQSFLPGLDSFSKKTPGGHAAESHPVFKEYKKNGDGTFQGQGIAQEKVFHLRTGIAGAQCLGLRISEWSTNWHTTTRAPLAYQERGPGVSCGGENPTWQADPGYYQYYYYGN